MYELTKKFKEKVGDIDIVKQEGIFSLTIFTSCLPCGFPPYLSKYYGVDFGAFLYLHNKQHGALIFNLELYRDVTRKAGEKFLSKGSIPEQADYIENKNLIFETYEKFTPEFIKNLKDEGLYQTIKEVYIMFFSVFTTTLFSEALDENLVKELYEKVTGGLDNFEEFFENVSLKNFESFVTRNARDLIEFNKNKENLYKYQWITTNYFLTPELPEAKKKLEQMIVEHEGVEGLTKLINEAEKEIAENNPKIEKYKETLSENLNRLFDFVQHSISLRDLRKAPLQRSITLLSNLVIELTSRMGDKSLAPFALVHDFVYEDFKIEGYKEILEKRKSSPMLIYVDEKGADIEYVDFEKAKKEFYTIVNPDFASIKEMTGSIGCKGYSKAKSKIVLSEDDFRKFEEGDILVTSMTRPEYVPLMKKASAIVTDEGGITCHAAIVSRELNKPCVIGTKYATQVLKDGDMVEVDANEGIVRLI